MKDFARRQIIWGLGLADEQAEAVRSMAGKLYSLKLWPACEMPNFADAGSLTMPCMICFSMEACRQFMNLPISQTGFLELTPKVLLLDREADMATLDEALSFGVSDIIREPVSRKRFAACLRKASEAAALQRDIQNLAHEVFIEREILERKNEALSFLVNFLSRISSSLNETELLGKAFTCLNQLFPVMTMQAAVFSRNDNGDLSADLFVAAPSGSSAYDAWRTNLLEIDTGIEHTGTVHPTTLHLPLAGEAAVNARPGDGHLMTLPIPISEGAQLYLVLLTSMERNLSRDQAMALDSALRYMASTIKNVRRYQEVCDFANRDGLTGAFNRRHFEQTMPAEIARHERYGEELSMLMLDIDHFKSINDTYGHLKGDEVLRTLVNTITATIRQTDYCVRYGGEEFAVLLPHTSCGNAAWLAERLREKVQQLSFKSGKDNFGITISLGVSCILPEERKNGVTLTNEADQALYQAKNSGRNRVVVFTPQEGLAVSL